MFPSGTSSWRMNFTLISDNTMLHQTSIRRRARSPKRMELNLIVLLQKSYGIQNIILGHFCRNCQGGSKLLTRWVKILRWHHNGHESVSNHQPHDCLLNHLFRRRWKKTSKLRVTGLCVRNSPGIGEFPAQMASNAENVSIWWRHHDIWPWYTNVTWLSVPFKAVLLSVLKGLQRRN